MRFSALVVAVLGLALVVLIISSLGGSAGGAVHAKGRQQKAGGAPESSEMSHAGSNPIQSESGSATPEALSSSDFPERELTAPVSDPEQTLTATVPEFPERQIKATTALVRLAGPELNARRITARPVPRPRIPFASPLVVLRKGSKGGDPSTDGGVYIPSAVASNNYKCHFEIPPSDEAWRPPHSLLLHRRRLMQRPLADELPGIGAARRQQAIWRREKTAEVRLAAAQAWSGKEKGSSNVPDVLSVLSTRLQDTAVEKFTVSPVSPMSMCHPLSFAPYVMDILLDVVQAQRRPAEPQCSGISFTDLTADGTIDLSKCPGVPAAGKSWTKQQNLEVFRLNIYNEGKLDIPGIAAIWTSCRTRFGCFENFRIVARNLVVPPPIQLQATSRPNILMLLFDSMSRRKFDQMYMELTDTIHKQLAKKVTVFEFDRTSVFGMNSSPNMKRIFGDQVDAGLPNLFEEVKKQGYVPSIMDDYCPDNGACNHFPFEEHKVCSKLLCEYGHDIKSLYHSNPNPGCIHGRQWAETHTDLIRSMWGVYDHPTTPIFHVDKSHGGHSPNFQNQRSQDHVYSKLILDGYLESLTAKSGFLHNTVVIIAADHGFHYSAQEVYNNFIGGEAQHRNPVLKVIVPNALLQKLNFNHEAIRVNKERLVTHLDLHHTLMDLASPTASIKPLSFNFLVQEVPASRTCRDAALPSKWCPCFQEKLQQSQCSVHPTAGCREFRPAETAGYEKMHKMMAADDSVRQWSVVRKQNKQDQMASIFGQTVDEDGEFHL